MVRFVADGDGETDSPVASSDAADDVAPVIPLFAGRPFGAETSLHTTGDDEATVPGAAARDDDDRSGSDPAKDLIEKRLLKKLRTRQLSIAEARRFLTEGELSAADADGLLDELVRCGYLDDDRLAEQLAYIGTERKGHGRRAIAQTLSRRGVSRHAAAAVLALLPDDEAERALEVARTKASTLTRVPPDTALRRLVGQLSRRGYAGGVAMDAARIALREHGVDTGRR